MFMRHFSKQLVVIRRDHKLKVQLLQEEVIQKLLQEEVIQKFCNPLGEVRCQDLEQMISSLEEERNKHISHIMTLEEKMSDLEVQCASLDARLNQRTTQLSDLQREITEKANEVIALEREVCSF